MMVDTDIPAPRRRGPRGRRLPLKQSAPLPEPQALTRVEAARLLGISVATLLRWEADDRRRPDGFFKTGAERSSPVRYARAALLRWIERRGGTPDAIAATSGDGVMIRGLTTIDGGVYPARIAIGDVEIDALALPPRMAKALSREGVTRVSQIYQQRYVPMVGDKTIAEASAVLVAAGYPPLKSCGSFLDVEQHADAWLTISPPVHLCIGG